MTIDLRIEKLVFGGSGLGYHEGRAVFVPLTAPGDLVRCRLTRQKKGYAFAELIEVIEPSSDRCTPLCPVFGECGGCDWQFLPAGKQASWKEAIFREMLQHKVGIDPGLVSPIGAPEQVWGYRSRVQLKCFGRTAKVQLGFYRRGSHFVVDIARCPLMPDSLNELIEPLRQLIEGSGCRERMPQVDLSLGDRDERRVLLHLIGDADRRLIERLIAFGETAGCAVALQAGRKESVRHLCGPEELSILPQGEGGVLLGYRAGGFAQIHLDQNRALVAEVLRLARISPGMRVLDLFCGMGNFSLPLAAAGGEVTGVEGYPPSIEQAQRNAVVNGIEARFAADDAAGWMQRHKGAFDLVVIDPPREGAAEVCRELVRQEPKRIIIISCDPATLCRDLHPLVHGGYKVVSSRPFDLFPQTHHLESVTLLERVK